MRKFVKRLSILYIIIRLVADFSLLVPSARQMAIDWGWPLTDLFVGVAITSIIVMSSLVIMDRKMTIFDDRTTLTLCVTSASWACILFALGGRLEVLSMQIDGFSWVVFFLATINYAATKELKEVHE